MGKTIRTFWPVYLNSHSNRILDKAEASENYINEERYQRKVKKIKAIDRKHYRVKIADGLLFGENIVDEYGDLVGTPKRKKYYKQQKHRHDRLKGKGEIADRSED